jgi:Sec-independent protein translocase protein TatA
LRQGVDDQDVQDGDKLLLDGRDKFPEFAEAFYQDANKFKQSMADRWPSFPPADRQRQRQRQQWQWHSSGARKTHKDTDNFLSR